LKASSASVSTSVSGPLPKVPPLIVVGVAADAGAEAAAIGSWLGASGCSGTSDKVPGARMCWSEALG